MKNKLFTFVTLGCIIAFLGACNKDKVPHADPNDSRGHTDNSIEQLRTFRDQIKAMQSGAKSNEAISLSDALWCVENNFNLTYTDAEQYYSQLTDHEFTLYLPVGNDHQVLVTDAVQLYDQAVISARDAIASDTFYDKGFVSLSITNAEEENGMVRVEFSGRTGERGVYNPPIAYVDGPFGEDDNWMFSTPLGKCDDPDIPSGADEQLQEKLFDALIGELPDAHPGFRNVYLDRIRFVFDGSNAANIYYSQDLDDLCIDHYSMNAYFYGEKKMITKTIPETYHLTHHTPISIEIQGMIIEDGTAVTHHNEIEYGIRMEVSREEFGDVMNILQ